MSWGSPVERETKRRIDVAVWAYAYEVLSISLADDATFDDVCRQIKPCIKTGRKAEDDFFANEFDPSTGLWIYRHPDLNGIRYVYWLRTIPPCVIKSVRRNLRKSGCYMLPRKIFNKYFIMRMV